VPAGEGGGGLLGLSVKRRDEAKERHRRRKGAHMSNRLPSEEKGKKKSREQTTGHEVFGQSVGKAKQNNALKKEKRSRKHKREIEKTQKRGWEKIHTNVLP